MFHRKTSLIRVSFNFFLLLAASLSLSCSGSVVDEEINAAARNYTPPNTAPGPVDPRVNSYEVEVVDGAAVKMSDITGSGKVVVVNFWATWCGPCKLEIPDLVALQDKFKSKGVEVVGLSLDDPEPERDYKVRVFAKQYSINYKIAFSPKEVFFFYNRANGSDPRAPIPQSFIFDKNGKLIDSIKGFRRDFRTWAEGAVSYALKNS